MTPSPRTGSTETSDLLPDSVRRELLPILAQSLRDESVDVADSAAIALGRAVATKDNGPILPLLLKTVAHPESSPRQAALLALGLCGGADAVATLRDVALDQPSGRLACGRTGPIDEMTRGIAALALGLDGTPASLSPLEALATSPSTSRELAAAAVLALGLEREAAPAAIVTLSRLLDDRSLDREVRAQVPIAIARLPASASRGMLPKLLDQLADKRTTNEVTRSIALALGRLATIDDGEPAKVLMDAARRNDDAATRQFALIALGRIFERQRPEDARGLSLHESVRGFLVGQLRHPDHRAQQPWAALALGLFGRGDSTCGTATPSPSLQLVARELLDAFEEATDPSLQGAVALSLGLLRANAAAATLRAKLDETAHAALRGHLALALGLLHDPAAIVPLRKLVADPSLPPSNRIDVARGLALLGDSEFEKQLIKLLQDAPDPMSASAYARALGLVGGRNAAPALKAMAEDLDQPLLQRSFAVVAIGLLAEKTLLPWNVPYLVDANYTVPLRPLEEVLDIL